MTLRGDCEEMVFKTGEVAFVPKGAPYGWRSTETVRKIFCSFLEKEAAAASFQRRRQSSALLRERKPRL